MSTTDDPPNPPIAAADFNRWLVRQPNGNALRALALKRARHRGWPFSILRWTPEQVAVLYREVSSQAEAGGISRWGGSGEPREAESPRGAAARISPPDARDTTARHPRGRGGGGRPP